MLLCGQCYENVYTYGVQTIHRSPSWTMDSLYAFKYRRFRNNRHTATFEIPCIALFETPCITSESHTEQ
jgi:hypothetical protein